MSAETRPSDVTDQSAMTMMEHLREFRTRIVRCALAVAVCAIVAYFFYDQIYNFLTEPFCKAAKNTEQTTCQLYFLDLTSPFATKLRVSGYSGLLLASPVVFYQIWAFIAPALYRKEKRWATAFVGSSVVLFLLGAALAFYSMPAIFTWLAQQAGSAQIQTVVAQYLSLLTVMVVAFGVAFEFPLLLVVLQLLGVVQPATLAQYRRHAIVAIVAVVAIITPGGDPISLMVLSVPLIIFYEMSIFISRIVLRRRETPRQPQAD